MKLANTCRLRIRRRLRQAGSRGSLALEFQAAQTSGLFLCHIVGHHEHLEGFTHSFGADQVLELQRDLGALLRELAILKRVGKLGFFSDAK